MVDDRLDQIADGDDADELAAEQAAEACDFPIGVVPTRSVPEAFSALLVYDPEAPLEENLEAIERQLAAAKTTFEEARKRYAVGLSNYLTVLTTLASYQQIQLSKVKAELDVLSARVSVMNALGGDWTKQLLK